MSTIILNCAWCKKDFEKDKHEVSRRKYKTKSNRWFCSRSCSASYGNKYTKRDRTHLPRHHGNDYARIYDPEISWYMSRCCKDARFRAVTKDERLLIHEDLLNRWTGICAISEVPLVRRSMDGSCAISNPFFIASVDRIDCSKPYEPGNLQWTSLAINLARNKMENEEFKEAFKQFREIKTTPSTLQ